ncbi:polysaccharide deacetylase family protein [Marinivivus vitaminiproducens]|uniref:polysaccharide deacetylase family protein n=1 Tax=Marinivivus vitaminiproducens TaxID=3035935 RepID=UPI00279DF122|nr:polysaccharide deacetylase family protein [Geminicoccaceae bacterium SCSIO 64248]
MRPAPRAVRRWHPSPAIAASLLLHGSALLAFLAWPRHWPALLAVLIANHAVLTAYGMIPRSGALGPNITRLPRAWAARGAVALTFDDGPDPAVTPAVLDLLDRHGAKATFFCIGERVESAPDLARTIRRRGHDIANHTHRHPYGFAAFGPWRTRREIERAGHAIRAATGRPATLFRAPMGLRSPLLDPVLSWTGYRLVSWSGRGLDGVDGRADKVLRRLGRNLRPGAILLLHDGNSAWTSDGKPVVLEVLPRLLAIMAERRLRSVTLGEALRRDGGDDESSPPADARSCR